MAGNRASYEGYVQEIMPVQTFSSGFKKRELIVSPNEREEAQKYPEYVSITFTKEDTAKLDSIRKGMKVRVEFFIGGRKWDNPKTGRTSYFNELRGSKIEVEGGVPANTNVPPPAEPTGEDFGDAGEDDMPF